MSAPKDYRALLHELLRLRWAEGPLADETEGSYAERFDDIWDRMTPDERETHEQWARTHRIHAVVFQEDDRVSSGDWVARTLGYDLLGQSDTRSGAIALLKAAVEQYMHLFRQPLVHVHPPAVSFIEWAAAGLLAKRKYESDEHLLIERDDMTETWTLYVAVLE